MDALKQILEELQNINTKIDNLDTKVDKLEAKVDKLDTKVDKLEAKVDNLEAKVDKLEIEQQSMGTILNSQNDHIQQLIQIVGATNAHLEEIKDGQQEQQRVLERLSYRSITQEADINDLRRIK